MSARFCAACTGPHAGVGWLGAGTLHAPNALHAAVHLILCTLFHRPPCGAYVGVVCLSHVVIYASNGSLLPRFQGEVDNCPTADEPLPYILALSYAARHPTMGTWTPVGGRDGDAGRVGAGGGAGSPFRNGTVQGATWYTVLGSMQVGGGETSC